MYLEKPKRLIIWNGGSMKLYICSKKHSQFYLVLTNMYFLFTECILGCVGLSLKQFGHSYLQLLHSLMTINQTEVMSRNGLRMLEELLFGLVSQIDHNNCRAHWVLGLMRVYLSAKVITVYVYLVEIQLHLHHKRFIQ